MSRTLPPLNALRAFEAAARHESFSRAAEELGVSHSAISRHVRGLEARLGVQLFRDASRGVALTAEGGHYMQRIRPAFDVIAEATEGLADTPAGRVVVNSEPLFATKVIAPLLRKLQQDLPEIELRLIASDQLADLDRFEADMAIRFAHKGVLDVPSDLISDAKLFPYAAPGLVPDNRIRVEHLGRYQLFRDRHELVWTKWCAIAGFDPALVNEGEWRARMPLAFEAAIHGAGLYMGSADCAAVEVVSGRLVRLSDVGFRLGAFHLLTSGQAGRRKAVRSVRTWLLDHTRALRSDENQPDG
ncbi:LysR family transcriptional regulator [uncultured Tateyamaria sp.]|uniref:LysR family transcriptional regulator n=1 Tax=uncultured Tateyamaria sp. TaxID=455651 RepID=UPI0026309ACD|nr:LysR family transcriptional regulator [uncultured Tateyamaria sp.]